jgi:hypothetical protein
MKLHVAFVALFLLTAPVAMIAGMPDPTLVGGGDAVAAAQDMHRMHGTAH